MITKKVKKTWNGLISVRDYEIQKALEVGSGMIIEFNKQKMTLSIRQLERGMEIISRVFISKTGGRNYRLIDFKWMPDQPVGGLFEKAS